MDPNPNHAFVVCAYGESSYLEDCIQSLLCQSIQSEVVVATSTENDYIKSLCSKYGLRLFVNHAPSSIGGDWNFGFTCTTAPYVTIAHQDDIYCPKYAERAVSRLGSCETPLLFFSDYSEIRNSGDCVRSNALLRVKRMMLLPLRLPAAGASIAMRRRILSFGSPICCPSVTYAVNNLPKPIFYNDFSCDLDWDAWERISKLEGSFLYEPCALMMHRIHEQSETTALIGNNVRGTEDLIMLKRFWPAAVAKLIYAAYSLSQRSNAL